MTDTGHTRCIECGGETDHLNEDNEGAPCPACAERLLATLPGLFHTPWSDASIGPAANESAAEPVAHADGDPGEAEAAPSERGHATGPRRID